MGEVEPVTQRLGRKNVTCLSGKKGLLF